MEPDTKILPDLLDLHRQATVERSHYYSGAVILRAYNEIERLRVLTDRLTTTDALDAAVREAIVRLGEQGVKLKS